MLAEDIWWYEILNAKSQRRWICAVKISAIRVAISALHFEIVWKWNSDKFSDHAVVYCIFEKCPCFCVFFIRVDIYLQLPQV